MIVFILTMPQNNSWNGRWSGQENIYAKVSSESAYGMKNIEEKNHYYSFGDGWVACVEVKRVDTKTANSYRKKSKGFCGYEWMIDEIIKFGTIRTEQERKNA